MSLVTFGLMAGVVVLVINDCCPGQVIDDILTVLAVGDIRKLVTKMIQGAAPKRNHMISVRRHALDNYWQSP